MNYEQRLQYLKLPSLYYRRRRGDILRLTVVSHEAKEEAATDRLATHAHEYFTGTDALKIENAITREPQTVSIHNSS